MKREQRVKKEEIEGYQQKEKLCHNSVFIVVIVSSRVVRFVKKGTSYTSSSKKKVSKRSRRFLLKGVE